MSRSTIKLMTSDHLGTRVAAPLQPGELADRTPGYTFAWACRACDGVSRGVRSRTSSERDVTPVFYFWVDPSGKKSSVSHDTGASFDTRVLTAGCQVACYQETLRTEASPACRRVVHIADSSLFNQSIRPGITNRQKALCFSRCKMSLGAGRAAEDDRVVSHPWHAAGVRETSAAVISQARPRPKELRPVTATLHRWRRAPS
jgi:hypothetical protein